MIGCQGSRVHTEILIHILELLGLPRIRQLVVNLKKMNLIKSQYTIWCYSDIYADTKLDKTWSSVSNST